MNWLITGGCGFIGTALVRYLVKKGHNIRVLDNLSVGTREDLGKVCDFREESFDESVPEFTSDHVQLAVGNILDYDLVEKAARDADILVHLAANTGVAPSVEDPFQDCYTNVIGTLNCLESARMSSVERFVFASSGAPVGEVDPPIHEKLPAHPVSPYGASKLAGEGYCSAYYRTYGLSTVALRFGNVYGPGSLHKDSVVAKFIRQAKNGEVLEIYGNGSQTRDFIFIDDLISAIYLSSRGEGICGEIFQIASNKELTINELAGHLVKLLKMRGIEKISITNGSERSGDVKRNYSDTTKARSLLGWIPMTNLEDGLEATVEDILNA